LSLEKSIFIPKTSVISPIVMSRLVQPFYCYDVHAKSDDSLFHSY